MFIIIIIIIIITIFTGQWGHLCPLNLGPNPFCSSQTWPVRAKPGLFGPNSVCSGQTQSLWAKLYSTSTHQEAAHDDRTEWKHDSKWKKNHTVRIAVTIVR